MRETSITIKDPSFRIRNMTRPELDQLVDWAADEGWNPGLNDAEIFWKTDPEAFIAAEVDGRLIGGGSIVSYGGQYGFMGFFIIHPDFRGQGLGDQLWHERLRRLRSKLNENAPIGMDGVFDMQEYYARGGFRFDGRDLRFEGTGRTFPGEGEIIDLARIPFIEIEAYDRTHFPAPRRNFLRLWISQAGCFAKTVIRDNCMAGYAVMRPCRNGYKIGPLFADDPEAARQLFRSLLGKAPGEPVYLDVPEENSEAMEMVEAHGMKEVFGCARMYHGAAPDLPRKQIFGVTTFELG